MEVWQRERENEGLRRESKPSRADLEVQVLARAVINLFGDERLQRRFCLADHRLQVSEGNRSHQGGRGERAVLESLDPPHRMMPYRFDLKMERRHIVEEARVHEIIRIDTGICKVGGRTVEKASDGSYGLQEGRHAEVVE